jgi:hypothetical protein
VADIECMRSLLFSSDAATVYGLAATALPFAESVDDEVERWLRPLRLYGDAGAVLQGLAIGEAPLIQARSGLQEPSASSPDETLTAIAAAASEFADERGAAVVGTVDLLVAVMRHYPDAFERALYSRGSDCAELVERLASSLHAALP